MVGAVSRWLGSVDDLAEIAQRLLRVQIENALALEVIERYDDSDTLFYCDSPYPHDSRGDSQAYLHEMTDDQHRRLSETLHRVQGKVVLSSYHCDLMNELYADWQHIEAPEKMCIRQKGRGRRSSGSTTPCQGFWKWVCVQRTRAKCRPYLCKCRA